jgi:hypothetical protein
MLVTYLVEMSPSLRSDSPYGPQRGVTLRKIRIFSPISSLNEKGFRLAINLMPMQGYLKQKNSRVTTSYASVFFSAENQIIFEHKSVGKIHEIFDKIPELQDLRRLSF